MIPSKKLISIFLFLFTLAAAKGQAATFQVNTVNDLADTNPMDGICDAGSGLCSLRAAIQTANSVSGSDTIQLEAEEYPITIAYTNGDATNGDFNIEDAVEITGQGSDATRITTIVAGRVFFVSAPSGEVVMRGLSIGEGTLAADGGGIYNQNSSLVLSDVLVKNNTVFGSSGAGIYSAEGSIAIDRCRFEDNRSTREQDLGGYGGAVSGENAVIQITQSTFQANHADAGVGGGFYSLSGDVTIIDSIFQGNSAAAGAAISLEGTETLTLEGSLLAANTATVSCGALSLDASNVMVTNSTVSGNSAPNGGGLCSNQKIHLLNSTVSANTSQTGGGGLSISTDANTIVIKNSIVAGNTSGEGPDCNATADFTLSSEGHNLIGATTGCAISGDTTGNILDVDAKLGALADNGGPTMTHALLEGSPAIDAAEDSSCPDTDQRGVTRPQRQGCDMGAFEAEASAPNPPIVPPTPTGFPPLGGGGGGFCSLSSPSANGMLSHLALLGMVSGIFVGWKRRWRR